MRCVAGLGEWRMAPCSLAQRPHEPRRGSGLKPNNCMPATTTWIASDCWLGALGLALHFRVAAANDDDRARVSLAMPGMIQHDLLDPRPVEPWRYVHAGEHGPDTSHPRFHRGDVLREMRLCCNGPCEIRHAHSRATGAHRGGPQPRNVCH